MLELTLDVNITIFFIVSSC